MDPRPGRGRTYKSAGIPSASATRSLGVLLSLTVSEKRGRSVRRCGKSMDTSSPAVFVNSEILKMYLGRRVRAVIQVLRNDAGVIVGKSTDGQQLTIKGAQAFPLSRYVEVIGIADSNQSIRAEMCTDFGENFDMSAYNGLCQLANGKFKNLFL